MLSFADLAALEERIKADMKRMESELSAVRILKDRMRVEGGGAQAPLDLGKDEEKLPFAQSVRQCLPTFSKDEFLVANVESVLKARGVVLPAKNARARIAMILQDLVKKGEVTVTRAGKGNTPYRYRVVAGDEAFPQKAGGTSVRPLIPPRVKQRPVRGQPTLAV